VQFVNAGQLPAAAQRLREALSVDPNNVSAEVNLAIILNQTGHRDDGFAEIQRAAKLDPDSAPVQVTLGDFYREMGRFTEARAAYESALRVKPGYDPAITRLHDLGTAATRERR
ncbi:MAG TPA: tetratricopeptide repeat protein, partial [Tepidisphaeraceae bacterium]|jgi:Flp pilus assembly protein TadD|nr:tetratricopeptide repeat protein [Tepidisphaeraceae bacterium]